MAWDPSGCGQPVMVARTTTLVPLMATPPACTRSPWVLQSLLATKLTMMRAAVGKWP